MWKIGYDIVEIPWVVVEKKIGLCGWLYWLRLNTMGNGYHFFTVSNRIPCVVLADSMKFRFVELNL